MQNLKRIVFSGCLGLLCVFAVQAKGKKGKGDGDANGPPKGDPSAFGPLNFDELPEGLPPANGGAFEGGETGSSADANANNSISEEEQQENGRFDVPTNGAPSPLFSAQPFTQQMLRFEE
ncbi:hypothetical protein N8633_00295, partial [bacterium]|nr:hypothetical protein [bacterium]MDB4796602.1 hypothetical protein [bacterium]